MNLDTTEFAAKCVYREPIKLATAPQYAISPTDLPALPPRPVNHYPNHAPITSYPSHALASSYPNLAPQTTYPNNVPLGNSPRSFRPPWRMENPSSLLSTSLNHWNPVDPVDSSGFPVDSTRLHFGNYKTTNISSGSGGFLVDCGGLLVDFWWITGGLLVDSQLWWTAGRFLVDFW